MKKRFYYSMLGCSMLQSLLFAAWSPPQYLIPVSHVFLNGKVPQVGIDGSGKAIAVWQYFDGAREGIQASYGTLNTWQIPVFLTTSDQAYNRVDPHVAMNSSGTGVSIWQCYNDACTFPQTSIFDGTTNTWSAPIDITSCLPTSNSSILINSQVAINNAGVAIAIWRCKKGDTLSDIQSATYDPIAMTWSEVSDITLNPTGTHSQYPQIAMNMSQAMGIWQTCTESICDIRAAIWSGGIWSNPTAITTNPSGFNSTLPVIGMDNLGNCVAVWQTSDDMTTNIQASTYDTATNSWTTPVFLTSYTDFDAGFPQLAVNSSGNAIATWLHADPLGQYIQASLYDSSTGLWSPIIDLSVSLTEDDIYPQTAIDSSGNGVVVWMSYDGTAYNIQASEYDHLSQTWSPAVDLITPNAGGSSAYLPQVATNGTESVAIWYRFDGTAFNIQSSTNP